MGVDPYLMWVIGAEVEGKKDPRFDRKLARKLDGQWQIEIPPLVLEGDEFWKDFDLMTGRSINDPPETRPYLDEVFYYGSPMQYSWDHPGPLIGWIKDESHDQHLLRGLYLIPKFRRIFEDDRPYIRLRQNPDLLDDIRYRHPYYRCQADDAYNENRLIDMYAPWKTDRWYHIAQYVLKLSGWTIDRKDLHSWIVFEWS